MAHRSIVELMRVSAPERDLAWLQESLVNAVQLELSTIPPYLTAYWSIKGGETKGMIFNIILQEMAHMGQAANLLTGIGGTPAIRSEAPSYPVLGLPGGVRPEVYVYLSSLTKTWLLEVAMNIEYPEDPIKATSLVIGVEEYPTIGAFYTAIQQAITDLQPTFDPSKQLSVNIGGNQVEVVSSVDEANAAITIIMEQGEGTSTNPDEPSGGLAHYYTFASIYHGREFVESGGTWSYSGDVIPWPETYDVRLIPKDGYPDAPLSVQTTLAEFLRVYGLLLDNLQAAWVNTDPNELSNAIINMGALQEPVIALMQTPISGGTGNYGPYWNLTTT
jgi:hypothetical protein